jgi:ABC-2 type transport system permease protein
MWAIIKKEFKAYFLSPIGYIYIGLFIAVCSLFFYQDIFSYQSANFSSIFSPAGTVLTFIVPILTMRMFAEERKNGTEQLLLTSPKSVTEIVLAKFLGAAFVVLVSGGLTIVYYFILKHFGNPEVGTSIIALLGFLLLSLAYVSFGMFISSLTENQIVAAIVSIAVFLVLWLLPGFSMAFSKFSLIYSYFGSFYNGTVALDDLVYLVSFTALFIVFTIMVIRRRKGVK